MNPVPKDSRGSKSGSGEPDALLYGSGVNILPGAVKACLAHRDGRVTGMGGASKQRE